MRERDNDTGRRGLERDGFSAEIDVGGVDWRMMKGHLEVVGGCTGREGLGEGEGIASRATVSGFLGNGGRGGAMMGQWGDRGWVSGGGRDGRGFAGGGVLGACKGGGVWDGGGREIIVWDCFLF